MNPQTLGEKIQAARLRAGLTQQQLCETVGLSYSTLAKIERGAIKSPSIFTIQQICHGVGVSMEQLLADNVAGAKSTPENSAVNRGQIKFLYSDINGVLVRYYQRAFVKLAHDIGRSVERVEEVFWRYNDAACRGELPEAELNKNLADQLEVQAINWRDYYIAAVEPVTEAEEFFGDLIKQIPIGLLSNIFPGYVEALMQTGKLPRLPFKTIVDSSQEHAIKPSKKIFDVAEERAGVKSAEILFVDDTLANVSAAEERGWQAILFDSSHPLDSIHEIKQLL